MTDLEGLYRERRFKRSVTLAILAAALLVTVLLALSIGPVHIDVRAILGILLGRDGDWPDIHETIILDVRLPRVLLGALVGAALAVAGCAMQGLFRNPMASPYVLGLSSAAAFGASLAILLGASLASMALSVPLLAFAFTLLTAFGVYSIARVGGQVPVETLLLAGIAIGAFFSAQVSLLKFLAGDELRDIVFWIMGGLWAAGWDELALVAPLIVLSVGALLVMARPLNALLLGEGAALDLGVEVERTKLMVLTFSALATAAAISVAGIIGFVGLIVPHIVRIFVGPDHRVLLPASVMAGAIFLIWCDTVARMVIAPSELPVGVVTASLGAPFFLYLLRHRRRLMGW